VSPALESAIPLKAGRMRHVVIVGLVSLAFGTFLAFFLEYWNKPK
jgi:hypothetical protein